MAFFAVLLHRRGVSQVIEWVSEPRSRARRPLFFFLNLCALPIIWIISYVGLNALGIVAIVLFRFSPSADVREYPAAITWFVTQAHFVFTMNVLTCSVVIAIIRLGMKDETVSFFVRFASAFLWRIIEFQKGAVAALVALATAALALLKLYVG